jgi:hypothetical protein
MPVSLKIRNPDFFERAVLEGVGIRPTIRIGLTISGPASAYALVWEFGSSRISKPGPKTTWGINPDGEVVILTKTAPYGFIRTNIPKFRQIVREEMDAVDWAGVRIRRIRETMLAVLEEAAQRCAEVIAESAPYDTGQLKEAIEVAQIGETTTDLLTIRPRLAL